MLTKVDDKLVRSMINQLMAFHTPPGFPGFGLWYRDRDIELTPGDGRLFQYYAALGVLVRDMYLYLEHDESENARLFKKIAKPIIEENQRRWPAETIFRPSNPHQLPEGFAAAAAAGRPTVKGLDDQRIVREWTTKPGKQALYAFCREIPEFCGPGGLYEQIRQHKGDVNKVGIDFTKNILKRYSDDPTFCPLVGLLLVSVMKEEIANICEMTTILFCAAEPLEMPRLRLDKELREIHTQLLLTNMRERFNLVPYLAVQSTHLSGGLLSIKPKIVHFSGHSTTTGALCFEDQSEGSHPIDPEALAALFEQFAGKVKCVILNACFSEAQANAIARHIDYVIGMSQEISDEAAIAFAIGFYQALGSGSTIEEAYRLGCVQIRLQNIPEYLIPVLVKKISMKREEKSK